MKKIIVNVTLLLVSLVSCKIKNTPENFGVKTSPVLATPLLDVDLTLRDVVNSQEIQPTLSEKSDGVYVLSYRDTFPEVKISDYIKLENQKYSVSYSMPTLSSPPGQDLTTFNLANMGYTYQSTESGEFDFAVTNGQKLTKIIIKSGTIDIKTTSLFPEKVQTIIEFPDVLDNNNNKLSLSFTVLPNSGTTTNTINLAGYELDLTKGTAPENKIRYIVKYSVNKPAGSTSKITTSNNSVSFDIELNNINYSYLEGYLGEITLPVISDSVVVELFKNSIEGDLEFTEPLVTIGVDNSAGINANLKISPLDVSFSKRNMKETITRNNSSSFLDTTIAGALVTAPNTTVTTNVNWTAQNSNIQKAFKPSPFTVKYNANVVLNKIGSISPSTKNFITDKSTVRVRAEVDLPLIGTINKLTITDTVKLTVNNAFQDSYGIEYIKYKINTSNGFPIDCKFQAYFMDSSKVITDSLVGDNKILLPASIVDGNGKTISTTPVYYEKSFTKAQYDKNIKNAAYVLLYAKFNSKLDGANNPTKIKIFAEDKLKVKLSGEAKVNVNASTK